MESRILLAAVIPHLLAPFLVLQSIFKYKYTLDHFPEFPAPLKLPAIHIKSAGAMKLAILEVAGIGALLVVYRHIVGAEALVAAGNRLSLVLSLKQRHLRDLNTFLIFSSLIMQNCK